MIRQLAALALPLGLALALPVAAAPVPADRPKDPPCYLPTAVGTVRVYRTTQGNEWTVTTTKVDRQKDGALLVTEQNQHGGQRHPPRTRAVSKDGVSSVPPVDGVAKPRSLMSYPLTPGRVVMEERVDADHVWTSTVVGEETVKVPAGEFKCVRIKAGRVDQGKDYAREDMWIAPNVGEVRTQAVDHLTGEVLTGGVAVFLQEFKSAAGR